jgi:hypothetical protein
VRRIPPSLCARCKGYKRLCGLPYCPILERFRRQVETVSRLSGEKLVDGDTPPSVVVGEQGFPHRLNIFYSIPPNTYGVEAREHDNPPGWAERRLPLRRILDYRLGMVAARISLPASSPAILYERELSLASVSEKPVDSEAELEKPPIPMLRFDGILAPQSPSAPAARVRVSGNPKLHPRLEKLIWDDVKASEGVVELYQYGVDVYTIVRAFSLGLLGLSRNRHLVPTRWSITAVDQIVSSELLRKVKAYDTLGEYEVYHAGYLGNYFTIILAPGKYEAEMIEVWHPLTPWTRQAREPIAYHVRETHALKLTEMDGGYMAARLPIAEHLYQRKRQATVIIVREITREYYAPVGNWHIRETVRRALQKGPIARCSSLHECLREASSRLKSSKARGELYSSTLVKRILTTKTLDKFLRR